MNERFLGEWMTSISVVFSKIRSLGLDVADYHRLPAEKRVRLWQLNSEKFNRLYAERRSGVKVIDLGCGWPAKRALIRDQAGVENYVGIDFEMENQPDVVANVAHMPFAGDSLDLVRAFALFEHTYNYQEILDEVFRVLRPGGSLFIQTPFWLEFHGYPSDYFRYTHVAWQRILQDTGYKVVDYDIEWGFGFFTNLANVLEHGSFSFPGTQLRWFWFRLLLRVLGKAAWWLRWLDKHYRGQMYASVLILGEKPAGDDSSNEHL